MTALKRELTNRGILYESSEDDIMRGVEYDVDSKLVTCNKQFVVTAIYSDVMPPMLMIYDRKTLKPIGEQFLYPDRVFGAKTDTWWSHAYE